jgi:hypothetical protein
MARLRSELDDQGFPQNPGAAASPCIGVERKHCSEGLGIVGASYRPARDEKMS